MQNSTESDTTLEQQGDLLVCVDYKDGIVPIASADHRILAKTRYVFICDGL